MKETSTLKSSNYFQLFIIIFYCLIFTKNYLPEEDGIYNFVTAVYVVLGVVLTIYFLIKFSNKYFITTYVFWFIIFSIVTFFFSNNFRGQDLLLANAYFGLAIIPVIYKLNYNLFKLFNYIIIIFFAIYITLGILPDDVFPRTSRNFISVLLLIGCSYHYISSYQNNLKPSFLIVFFSLIISLWAIGRSGIIVFSILTIFYPIYLKISNVKKTLMILSIFILTVFIFIFFSELLIEVGLSRFESMGVESERNDINSDYISSSLSSLQNLFFGPPYSTINSIVHVELNPHNSFIRLHTYYGLVGFVFFIVAYALAVKYYIKGKNLIFLFLLFALTIRSYLDSTAFHGPFDPIIYFLIFYNFKTLKLP